MRWILTGAGIAAGAALYIVAWLTVSPTELCHDRSPVPAVPQGTGYVLATFDARHARLPLPAAECRTALIDVDSAASAIVIDWPATALAAGGVIPVLVSLAVGFRLETVLSVG